MGASVLVADPTPGGRVQAFVAGGFSLLAGLIVLFGPFAAGDAGPAPQTLASLEPSPVPTETVTVEASPAPAETITLEPSPLPAETVTATAEPLPAETVTVEAEPLPAETVTETITEVETEYIEIEPQGLLDSDSDGDSSGGGSVYFENCDAARAAGADPVRRGDPGYASHLDRDGDGIGCE